MAKLDYMTVNNASGYNMESIVRVKLFGLSWRLILCQTYKLSVFHEQF